MARRTRTRGRGRLSKIDLMPEECDGIIAWAAQELGTACSAQELGDRCVRAQVHHFLVEKVCVCVFLGQTPKRHPRPLSPPCPRTPAVPPHFSGG